MVKPPTFVRSIWGFPGVEGYGMVKRCIENAASQKYSPEPMIVYCYGQENYDLIKGAGFNCRIVGEYPIHNFSGDKSKPIGNDGTQGQLFYGCSMWLHKTLAMCYAMREHKAIVHLDWDTHQIAELPNDFWDRLALGEWIQGSLRQFRQEQCRWRKSDRRKMTYGAFLYCNDYPMILELFDLYRNKHPKKTDEQVISLMIDEELAACDVDVSDYAAAYDSHGYEPYCVTFKNQIIEPEVVLFRDK